MHIELVEFFEKEKKKGSKARRDLYTNELEYVNSAMEEIDQYINFAKSVMIYWEDSFLMEIQRLQAIQLSFQKYFQKYCELWGQSNTEAIPLKHLESLSPSKEAELFLSIENLFAEEQLNQIKTSTSIYKI